MGNCLYRSRMNTALLAEIERFLERSGYSASRFGVLAAGNGKLVQRLRAGSDVTTKTEARIRQWIAENEDRRPNRGWRGKAPS